MVKPLLGQPGLGGGWKLLIAFRCVFEHLILLFMCRSESCSRETFSTATIRISLLKLWVWAVLMKCWAQINNVKFCDLDTRLHHKKQCEYFWHPLPRMSLISTYPVFQLAVIQILRKAWRDLPFNQQTVRDGGDAELWSGNIHWGNQTIMKHPHAEHVYKERDCFWPHVLLTVWSHNGRRKLPRKPISLSQWHCNVSWDAFLSYCRSRMCTWSRSICKVQSQTCRTN